MKKNKVFGKFMQSTAVPSAGKIQKLRKLGDESISLGISSVDPVQLSTTVRSYRLALNEVDPLLFR